VSPLLDPVFPYPRPPPPPPPPSSSAPPPPPPPPPRFLFPPLCSFAGPPPSEPRYHPLHLISPPSPPPSPPHHAPLPRPRYTPRPNRKSGTGPFPRMVSKKKCGVFAFFGVPCGPLLFYITLEHRQASVSKGAPAQDRTGLPGRRTSFTAESRRCWPVPIKPQPA